MGKVIEHHHTLDFIEILAIDQIRRGLRERSHPFRHMVVSTSAADGAKARMVVMREMEQRPFVVWFHTDIRSEKISEIRENPLISLLFWHPSARLQLRLRASATVHHQNAVSQAWWKGMESGSKLGYAEIRPPGSAKTDLTWMAPEYMEKPSDENFAVIACAIQEMDVLQLSRSGQIRAAFIYEKGARTFQHFLAP